MLNGISYVVRDHLYIMKGYRGGRFKKWPFSITLCAENVFTGWGKKRPKLPYVI